MWADFIDDCRDRGLLFAVFIRLVVAFFFIGLSPIWLPCVLIEGLNEWTKTWFGGKK